MKAPVPMHIPDGFLSIPITIVFWLFSVTAIFIALKRAENEVDERRLPLMGVMAAAIFAGQMLNFAVAGGTSGHLLGSALAVIMLGAWPAVLVMVSVVAIQGLVFQDGGLLAMGANLFNMAVLGVAVAYFVFRIFQILYKSKKWAVIIGSFAAGWASIFIASLAAGLQLALSGTSPANIAVPAMGSIHALIGIGEGIITASAVGLILKARPGLIENQAESMRNAHSVWIAGLILTIILVILSPLASSKPDGLESVAEKLGIIDAAREPLFQFIPDYVLPGILNESLATIAAGIIGTIIVAGVALATSRRNSNKKQE